MRSVTEERRESEEKCATVKEQGRLLNSELAALKEAGEALDSQEGQKVNFLKKLNPEVHQGWEWLQDNLDKFEKPVFGPPMLTCSLKDERYSSLVQSMLQANDFLCFTCQTRNDHKTLSEQFYKNMSLSVTIRTCGTEFQSFRSPMTADELHTLGLDGFAIDYMEGPDPVLAMLCSERFLHASGVALDEISSDQYDTLQNGQKINTWATGQTYFRVIRRREYGPDATTTSTRKVNQGRFWTEQPIDTEEKVEIQRKISEKLEQKKVLVDEFQAMKAQSQELVGKGEDASAEIVRPAPLVSSRNC